MNDVLRLLPGADNFHVEEIPAYLPEGHGEHLYVHLHKRGHTSDTIAEALGRACAVAPAAVGFAGRKDRHAVTSQWFSIQGAQESQLDQLAEYLPPGGTHQILAVSRHRNKIKPGHLAGNRFRLGLAGSNEQHAALQQRLHQLAHYGVPNRFGPQRFGLYGASLIAAAALGRGDYQAAVERLVDASGQWHLGDPLPGFRPGLEGRIVGALRRGQKPKEALRAGGEPLRRLLASAAQSAIFNAVLEAREQADLLHRVRPGDIAIGPRGGPFLVKADECDEVNQRAAPGVLGVRASGPLPGHDMPQPDPQILAQEQAWSAATGQDWSWFAKRAGLSSSGERRPLVVLLRSPATLSPWAEPVFYCSLELPPGAYATSVLSYCGVALPEDRRGEH